VCTQHSSSGVRTGRAQAQTEDEKPSGPSQIRFLDLQTQGKVVTLDERDT